MHDLIGSDHPPPEGWRRLDTKDSRASAFVCDTSGLVVIAGYGKSSDGPFAHASVIRPRGIVRDDEVARVRKAFFVPEALVCEYRTEGHEEVVHLCEVVLSRPGVRRARLRSWLDASSGPAPAAESPSERLSP